jgi:hypothetical protein
LAGSPQTLQGSQNWQIAVGSSDPFDIGVSDHCRFSRILVADLDLPQDVTL